MGAPPEGAGPFNPKNREHQARSATWLAGVYVDFVCDVVRPEVVLELGAFAAEHGLLGRSCAMWVDLEGCAYEALTAAGQVLAQTRCLMIEVEDVETWSGQRTSGDIEQLMRQAGFVPAARDYEYGQQHNVVFTRPELAAALVAGRESPGSPE